MHIVNHSACSSVTGLVWRSRPLMGLICMWVLGRRHHQQRLQVQRMRADEEQPDKKLRLSTVLDQGDDSELSAAMITDAETWMQ
eukprot:551741-Amphidinium_carterae.1